MEEKETEVREKEAEETEKSEDEMTSLEEFTNTRSIIPGRLGSYC